MKPLQNLPLVLITTFIKCHASRTEGQIRPNSNGVTPALCNKESEKQFSCIIG